MKRMRERHERVGKEGTYTYHRVSKHTAQLMAQKMRGTTKRMVERCKRLGKGGMYRRYMLVP